MSHDFSKPGVLIAAEEFLFPVFTAPGDWNL